MTLFYYVLLGFAVLDIITRASSQGRLHHPVLPYTDRGTESSVYDVDERSLQHPRVQAQEKFERVLYHSSYFLDEGYYFI